MKQAINIQYGEQVVKKHCNGIRTVVPGKDEHEGDWGWGTAWQRTERE